MSAALSAPSASTDVAETSREIERWLMRERLATTRHPTSSADWTVVCEEQLDPSGAISTDVYLLHMRGDRILCGPNVFLDDSARVDAEVARLRRVVA